MVQELRAAGAVQGAGRVRDARLGRPRSWRSIVTQLDPEAVEDTLGVVLKSKDDIDALRGERLAVLLARVPAATVS